MNLYDKIKLERNEINKGADFMKKLVAILLTLVFCLGIFVSCDNETPTESSSEDILYKSEEIHLDTSGVVLPFDNDICNIGVVFCEKDNMLDKQLLVYGKLYDGSYISTNQINLTNAKIDYYENKESGVSFAFFENTDNLKYFKQKIPNYSDEKNNVPNEDLMRIAQELANRYLTDTSLYEVHSEKLYEYPGTNEMPYAEMFIYVKKVQGYYTNDYFYTVITNSGIVAEISIGQIGVFDDLYKIDNSKLRESIESELKKQYETNGAKIVDKAFYGQSIFKDEASGEITILSGMWINLKLSDESEKTFYPTFATTKLIGN